MAFCWNFTFVRSHLAFVKTDLSLFNGSGNKLKQNFERNMKLWWESLRERTFSESFLSNGCFHVWKPLLKPASFISLVLQCFGFNSNHIDKLRSFLRRSYLSVLFTIRWFETLWLCVLALYWWQRLITFGVVRIYTQVGQLLPENWKVSIAFNVQSNLY